MDLSITSFRSRVKKLVGSLWDEDKAILIKSGGKVLIILPDNGSLYSFSEYCAEYTLVKVANRIKHFLKTGVIDKRSFWQIYGSYTPLPPEFSGVFGFEGHCGYNKFLAVVRAVYPEVGIQEVPRPDDDFDIKDWK